MTVVPSQQVQGDVSPGFEAVRDAFAENFARRRELSGACCVYLDGEEVVDLRGGIRNKKTGELWERDTMVVVGSPDTGGALGFADPDAGIGYGYLTSRMGMVFTGDPRKVALRDALSAALRSRPRQRVAVERIAS